jgi:hypothetical protein
LCRITCGKRLRGIITISNNRSPWSMVHGIQKRSELRCHIYHIKTILVHGPLTMDHRLYIFVSFPAYLKNFT